MNNRGARIDYRGSMKTMTPKVEVYEGKQKTHNLSPRPGASFGWGDSEAGGMETARAILLDFTDNPVSESQARGFYADVISKIQGRAWGVFGWRVYRWLKGDK